ncbi:MAG: hypothetical protein ACI8S6_004176 [Myxococcota bacterium]|jgi:hypothetical protein
MGLFLVSTRGGEAPVEVEAPNWLVALGIGLDALGEVTSIDRLACEVLANGKVIARDVRTGTGFIVQLAEPGEDAPRRRPPPEAEDVLIATDADDEDDDETFSVDADEALAAFVDDETFSMPASAEDLIETVGEEEEEDEPLTSEVAWEAEAPFFGVGVGSSGRPAAFHSLSKMPEPVVLPEEDADVLLVGPVSGDLLETLDEDDDSEALWAFPFAEDDDDPEESTADPPLQEVLDRIRESVTVDAVWQEALGGAHGLVPCESGAALRQEWDGTLRFIAALGPQSHKVLGERVPAGLGIVGFCVERRVSLLIRDPKHDPRFFANMDRRTGYHTACVLAVPVLYESTTFGCLELLNAPSGFSRRDLERLVSIADMLAEQLLVVV